MISKSNISDTLKKLDKLYSNSTNYKETEFYAKLAIIELCGWIEVSFDDIICWYIKKNISKKSNKFCMKKIVGGNSGFHYEYNIRPMFFQIIGLKKLEMIENKLDKNGDMDKLESMLANLKENRNKAAHNCVIKVTRSFDAPSKLCQDFETLFIIMQRIENEIRSLN